MVRKSADTRHASQDEISVSSSQQTPAVIYPQANRPSHPANLLSSSHSARTDRPRRSGAVRYTVTVILIAATPRSA